MRFWWTGVSFASQEVLRTLVLLNKVQASFMYAVTSANRIFCAKHIKAQ